MAEVSMDGIMAYKLGYGGPVKRMLCRFWLHGVCTDRNCPYEHHSRYSEVAFCKFILTNKECPYGAKCMFRHNEDFEDFLIGNNTMPDDTLLAAHTDPANYSVDQKDNQDAIISKIADDTHSPPPHGDDLPLRNRFDGLDIEEVPPSSIVSTPPLPPPPSCCRKKEDSTSSSSLMRKEQPGKKQPAQKTKSNKKSNSNCQMSGKKKEKMTDKQTSTFSSLMTGKKEQTDNFGQTEKTDGADKPINSASLEKNAVNPSSDTFGLLAGAIKSGSGKIFSFSDNEDDNNALYGFLKDHMWPSNTLEEVKIIVSHFYETKGKTHAEQFLAVALKGCLMDRDLDWKKAALAKSSKSK